MSWVYKTGIDMPHKILNSQKKISATVSAFILSLSLFSTPIASAAVGDLDAAFDADGRVTTNFGALSDYSRSIALQSNGKIVVAGYSNTGSNYDFAVSRYNTNGSLDTLFGTEGKVTTAIGAGDDLANSIVLQSDGKIVVAGQSQIASSFVFAVVRYNTDGSLDTTFGTDGIATTDFGSGDDIFFSMALQSDHKIVAVGSSYISGKNVFAVVRYNADGSLDTSFSSDGIVTTTINASNDAANSIAVQGNGKIVVTGLSEVGTSHSVFAVVRYNADGSLDTSFSLDGIVTTAIDSFDDRANSIALQNNGKIVAAGYSKTPSKYNFAVVRYNTDGSLDTTFGIDGIVTTAIGPETDVANSIALQSDGKIVSAGRSYQDLSNDDFAVVRYNTDGSLDTTFGTDGIATTDFGAAADEAYSIAVQSDGKFVIAGASVIAGNSDFAIVRYIASDSTAPSAPTLNSVTSGNRRITVVFTAGANNGAAITDYEYSLNGGAYTSAGTTTSPFTIDGLSGRTVYSVTLKARNSVGLSSASSSLSATTTDSSQDASEAATAEAARVAATAEAAKKAKEQKELIELLSVIPSIAGLSLNLGDLANSLLTTTCVKGKTVKNVKKGAKCPKGFVKKK